MRRIALLISLLATPMAFAGGCRLEYDPVSIQSYYRAEGWALPGTSDFNPAATPRLDELPPLKPVSGAVAELLPHDEYPYIVEFPPQEFVLSGARQKMRHAQLKVGIVRWRLNGHIIAYSYGMVPVTAKKVNGRWEIRSELGCIFAATFIDDKGDGVFRLLVPGSLNEDLIPLWALPKQN